jgi:hypothetical protein
MGPRPPLPAKRFWAKNGVAFSTLLVYVNGVCCQKMNVQDFKDKVAPVLKTKPLTFIFRVPSVDRDKIVIGEGV